jgi:hypothetical protein
MSNYRTYRLLLDSSKNIWLKEAIDQRKLTRKSTPNDNIMIIQHDIYCSIVKLLLNIIEGLSYEQK